jgi:hypothetical protein
MLYAITTTVYTFGGSATDATVTFTYWIDFCGRYGC